MRASTPHDSRPHCNHHTVGVHACRHRHFELWQLTATNQMRIVHIYSVCVAVRLQRKNTSTARASIHMRNVARTCECAATKHLEHGGRELVDFLQFKRGGVDGKIPLIVVQLYTTCHTQTHGARLGSKRIKWLSTANRTAWKSFYRPQAQYVVTSTH